MPRLALLLSMLVAACGGGESGPSKRVVLITVDTLRFDSLTPEHMPLTREFAGEGQIFQRFYASTSTTQPTHASLLTGLHPWQHGVTRNGIVLDDGFETLAESLARGGFTTSAVVSSFPLHGMFGYGQGFDEYHDEFDEPYVREWEGQELEEGRFYSLADSVTEQALAALDRADAGRQFFWFHYFDPHDPYGDAPAARGAGVVPIAALLEAARERAPGLSAAIGKARRQYDADVRDLDRALGRLFERLAADASEVETHVVFTSDHGESFGEKGCLGHGKRVTPEQVHVPFFVVSPSLDPAIRRDQAGSIDVPRTVLSLAGVRVSAFGGRDLTRAWEDGPVLGMRRTFATPKTEQLTDGTRLAVEGERFFTVFEGRLYSGDAETVYRDDDPDQETTGDLAMTLRALFRGCSALLAGVEAEELLDEDVQDALQKLGYGR